MYKLICKKFKILVAIITIHVYFNIKRIHSSKKLFYKVYTNKIKRRCLKIKCILRHLLSIFYLYLILSTKCSKAILGLYIKLLGPENFITSIIFSFHFFFIAVNFTTTTIWFLFSKSAMI